MTHEVSIKGPGQSLRDTASSTLELYQPFLPPAGLPPPWLPMLPWGRHGLDLMSSRHFPLAGNQGEVMTVSSGTVALAVGLRACGVKPGQRVAMPGYHCPRMVEAVLALGAIPLLIDLTPDLDYEQAAAERAIEKGIAAFMLVNFFGRMPRNAKILADRCRAVGIPVIEDCAHADIALHGRCHGDYGDVVAYSLRKFYPLPEGGMVILRHGIMSPVIESADVFQECRSAWRWMCDFGRSFMRHLFRGRNMDAVSTSPLGPSDVSPITSVSSVSFPEQRRAARVSMLLWRFYSSTYCRELRWRNYTYLSTLLADEVALDLVDLALPPEQTPYVLLARLAGEDPDRQYVALKRHGIPVWRWDRLYGQSCRRSRELGRRLVQFPVHQDLKATDVEWLADTIHRALQTS